MNANKTYHVLKREFGSSTHYSELPIVCEGTFDECYKYVCDRGFSTLCPVMAHGSDEILYSVYFHNNEDFEYLIA